MPGQSELNRATIIFVDHTPFAGGAQLVLAEHIAQLDKQQFQAVVICTNTVPELIDRYQQAGAKVITIDMPRLRKISLLSFGRFIRAIVTCRQICQSYPSALVVANSTRASYIATLAVMWTKIPIYWWVRDYLYPRALFHLLKPRVAKILFVSQSIKQHYLRGNQPQGQVLYVSSNMYRQLPQITPPQIAAERQRWGLAADDQVVGYMGRLVEEKGPQDLIEAILALRARYPKFKALIVGSGAGQQGSIEEELRREIDKHQAQQSIVMTGYQANEALYYSLFDYFVLPTRSPEPFSTTVVQAMMAKLPVIATHTGGTPEIVEDGQSGILIQPRQPDQLADAIERLLQQPELTQKLAQTGYQRALDMCREEVATAQLQEWYRQTLLS